MDSLILLEEEEKPSDIPGGIFWFSSSPCRAGVDCQSVSGLGRRFWRAGESGVEARFRPLIQAPHGCEPLGARKYTIEPIRPLSPSNRGNTPLCITLQDCVAFTMAQSILNEVLLKEFLSRPVQCQGARAGGTFLWKFLEVARFFFFENV